jgi:hypothetical protein
MGAKRKRTKRQKILDRQLMIDLPELHRPQGEGISEEIFNNEPFIQGSYKRKSLKK